MKLLREIRDSVTNSTVEISTVLRKAKVLAVTLENQEFKDWVSHELGGYPDKVTIPEYREIASPLLGNFVGPFHKVSGYLLPVSQMPDFMRESALSFPFPNPIKEIESMALTGGDDLRHPWPTEAVIVLGSTIRLAGNYSLVEVYQPISRAQLEKIIDAVRNRLLDFLLALQEIDPQTLESEDALRELPKETVNQVFHLSVYGSHNILAAGTGFSQMVTQAIPQNDEGALLQHLRQAGLSEMDLEDLKSALKKDGARPKGDFGNRVKAWMGKVVVKAIDGSWKVAAAAAPEVLTKALSAYYGWE